jgi:hypothetical protein
MGNNEPGKRFARKSVYVATGFALLAVIAGFGMAAFTIQQGSAITGAGAYNGANPITWWTESGVGVSVQPTVLPTTLSGVVGTPTVLAAAATNYGVNTAVANDVAQIWRFTEAAGATASTELELSFTVSTGAGPTVTTVVAYVETQATPPAGGATFTFYYDLGSASAGTITLNSVTEIAQQCSAVGTCP